MSRRKANRPELRLAASDGEVVGLASKVDIPTYEKELLKKVPAKVDGEVIGDAYIYDDGTVDVVIFKDAPEEAIAKIRGYEDTFGYSVVTED